MVDFIKATLNAGLQIALKLNNGTDNLFTHFNRGAGGDISIGADLLSEEIFITHLSQFGNIDSEEAGFIDNKKPCTIIIDPLDGSDNFTSRIPYYGASVALREKALGVIMNFCNLNAVVHYNGKNFYGNLAQDFLLFSDKIPQNTAKCGIFEGAYKNPKICGILKDNAIKFRSLGALALSLGLAHNVNFVLFSGEKRHYDCEAGFLITKDLYKIESQNLALISKDKILFDKISNLLF